MSRVIDAHDLLMYMEAKYPSLEDRVASIESWFCLGLCGVIDNQPTFNVIGVVQRGRLYVGKLSPEEASDLIDLYRESIVSILKKNKDSKSIPATDDETPESLKLYAINKVISYSAASILEYFGEGFGAEG